jgi:hypothetical protein
VGLIEPHVAVALAHLGEAEIDEPARTKRRGTPWWRLCPARAWACPTTIWVAVKLVLECDYFNGANVDVDGVLRMS